MTASTVYTTEKTKLNYSKSIEVIAMQIVFNAMQVKMKFSK